MTSFQTDLLLPMILLPSFHEAEGARVHVSALVLSVTLPTHHKGNPNLQNLQTIVAHWTLALPETETNLRRTGISELGHGCLQSVDIFHQLCDLEIHVEANHPQCVNSMHMQQLAWSEDNANETFAFWHKRPKRMMPCSRSRTSFSLAESSTSRLERLRMSMACSMSGALFMSSACCRFCVADASCALSRSASRSAATAFCKSRRHHAQWDQVALRVTTTNNTKTLSSSKVFRRREWINRRDCRDGRPSGAKSSPDVRSFPKLLVSMLKDSTSLHFLYQG